MSFSRVWSAFGALLLLVAAGGCAHSAGSPASRSAPGMPPAPPQGQATGAGALDPSEEMTPEELGTLPEPVPAPPSGGSRPEHQSPLPVAQEAPTGAYGANGGDPGAADPLWRVQIFATQDRELADRMAEKAEASLHAAAHVTYEAPVYKVRLGDYRSENEAAALRDLAVRSGYPGAFRIRCFRDATMNHE